MNWVQVYRDDVIASFWHSPALVATAGLETASLELNAHLRVQPAHCVYDFYFSTMPYRRPYNAVVRYASPPMIITLHLKFNCIKFVGPVDVRSLTHVRAGNTSPALPNRKL